MLHGAVGPAGAWLSSSAASCWSNHDLGRPFRSSSHWLPLNSPCSVPSASLAVPKCFTAMLHSCSPGPNYIGTPAPGPSPNTVPTHHHKLSSVTPTQRQMIWQCAPLCSQQKWQRQCQLQWPEQKAQQGLTSTEAGSRSPALTSVSTVSSLQHSTTAMRPTQS